MLRVDVPFILRFKRPVTLEGIDPFCADGVKFDEARGLWTDRGGEPLHAARASRPYTSVATAPHTIKGGYTPKGGYKPAKFVPGKMDKRAGK